MGLAGAPFSRLQGTREFLAKAPDRLLQEQRLFLQLERQERVRTAPFELLDVRATERCARGQTEACAPSSILFSVTFSFSFSSLFSSRRGPAPNCYRGKCLLQLRHDFGYWISVARKSVCFTPRESSADVSSRRTENALPS